ncbi:MAG TPA: pyrimidine 5'-nucleotidase [Thermohalobaculum sp.]|nr:pyrimidine 5'-nucleotidase [Thermohalobaculum sp.]
MPDIPDRAAVETWIFDLDQTLYHPSARIFNQIDARMTAFIMRELGLGRRASDRLRKVYWARDGITLAGLVAEHGVDPVAFLDEVHRIDLRALRPDRALAAAIRALPGTRIIHSNGARAHAERVLAARGLDGLFARIFGIDDKGFLPKPRPEAYAHVIEAAALDPARAVMVEDDQRNLEVPKALGMTTVWVCYEPGGKAGAHVDHRVSSLTDFLGAAGRGPCQPGAA